MGLCVHFRMKEVLSALYAATFLIPAALPAHADEIDTGSGIIRTLPTANNPYLLRRQKIAEQRKNSASPGKVANKSEAATAPSPALVTSPHPVAAVKPKPLQVTIPRPSALHTGPSTLASVTVLDRQLKTATPVTVTMSASPPDAPPSADRAPRYANTATEPPDGPIEQVLASLGILSSEPPIHNSGKEVQAQNDALVPEEAIQATSVKSDTISLSPAAAAPAQQTSPDILFSNAHAEEAPPPVTLASAPPAPPAPPLQANASSAAPNLSPPATPPLPASSAPLASVPLPPAPPLPDAIAQADAVPVVSTPPPTVIVERGRIDLSQGIPTEQGYIPPGGFGAMSPSAGAPETAPSPAPSTASTPSPAPAAAAPDNAPSLKPITPPPPQVEVKTANETKAPAPTPPAGGEPAPTLAADTRKTLKAMPSGIDSEKGKEKSEKLDVQHTKPTALDVFGANAPTNVSTVKEAPVQMEVRPPALDLNYELQRAYNALISGNTDAAIQIYQQVLSNDPNNTNALFGLAATYHRLGQTERAKPLYRKLLRLEPTHREGLNNFLALAAEESPEQALEELYLLEKRNPGFSPIPAQIAVIYQKTGRTEEAVAKMTQAISLSPENLTYKYNLAILFDKAGKNADAAALYSQLLEAWNRGVAIPGNAGAIQQRLTYLRSTIP